MEGPSQISRVSRSPSVKGDIPDYEHRHDTLRSQVEKDDKQSDDRHHRQDDEQEREERQDQAFNEDGVDTSGDGNEKRSFSKRSHHDHGNDPDLGKEIDIDG